MTTAESERRSPETPAAASDVHTRRVSAGRRVSGAIEIAHASAITLIERVPGTVRGTRAGVRGATTVLQRLPDSTLRWLAAGSIGLGAGLRLAGAPRLVAMAGAAPALLMGAAVALRSTERVVQVHEDADKSAGGMIDMTDEHTKGAISKAKGTIEEELGKLTGDKEEQAHGKAKQVQGDAQKGLGDIQDAIRGPKNKP